MPQSHTGAGQGHCVPRLKVCWPALPDRHGVGFSVKISGRFSMKRNAVVIVAKIIPIKMCPGASVVNPVGLRASDFGFYGPLFFVPWSLSILSILSYLSS